ncbi:MAG: nodulation protein NfeD [Anaerolineales bacterium]|jgi:membrane-bound serine protease (ClpP class)
MKAKTWQLVLLVLAGLAGLLAAPGQAASAQPVGREALVMTLDGPLSQSMVEYVRRGIETADRQDAEVLILELNTPGGSVTLMNEMVRDIRASLVPVVVYVAPSGSMAASAGTLITLAGHAAAMAPETTIGAASPVDASGQDLTETMAAKEKSVLKATARTLANQRGPLAVDLAEKTIDSAEAVTAQEALDSGLVDFIAQDVPDLLQKLDGFPVQTRAGDIVLATQDVTIVPLPVTFIERLLATLTDPNIVFLLLNLGVIAILIEISSPGGWIAGFLGVASLALAAYGLGVLPVNWFGIIFLVVAFVLFILDIKAPTHGALTAAGVGSLIVGALVLFNTPNVPGLKVSVPLVVFTSLITGGIFFSILLYAVRAQKVPIRTGLEALVGRTGTVSMDLNPRGQVHVGGEFWTAELVNEQPALARGARIEVVGVQGLKLLVRKA